MALHLLKNYNIQNEKLQYTTKKVEIYKLINLKCNNFDYKRILYKNVIEISYSNTTLYAIYIITNYLQMLFNG